MNNNTPSKPLAKGSDDELPTGVLSEDEARSFGAAEQRFMLQVGSRALAKACMDPFDYACGLRTGEVIRFTEAEPYGNGWVHLSLGDLECDGMKFPYPAPRGLDVRVADIVWVADAPVGS